MKTLILVLMITKDILIISFVISCTLFFSLAIIAWKMFEESNRKLLMVKG